MAFDTLKLARKLEDAGFPTAQAQGAAAALAETFAEDLATKRDLKEGETALRRDLRETETRLDTRISTLEVTLRSDLRDLGHRMTIRLGTMLAAAVVLVGAMVKLL